MADTVTCRPDELGRVLQEDFETNAVKDQRRMLKLGVGYVHEQMRAEAPRLTGDFAASIAPYIDEPLPTWQRGGGGGTASVETVVDDWRPGREIGVATDAPYSRKLIFHAGKYTKKVKGAWAEKIMDRANHLMEREE